MNIISFSRMKIFHKDGRARVILKLRLPRISSESSGAPEFNGFYEALADEYMSILGEVPHNVEPGSRPTTVTVDFSVVTEEYIEKHPNLIKKREYVVVIKRDVKINLNGKMRSFSATDIYNTKLNVFIK